MKVVIVAEVEKDVAARFKDPSDMLFHQVMVSVRNLLMDNELLDVYGQPLGRIKRIPEVYR